MQLIIKRNAPRNIIIQRSGGGYILPIASQTRLGGVIVGDNLSIDSNGVLRANAGGGGGGNGVAGVSSFNNRTGNIQLTSGDVSAVADGLYAKESNLTQINLGDGKVPMDTQRMGPSTNYRWDLYGIVSNQTKTYPSNGTEISYIGLHTNANVDRPYIGKWFRDDATGKETQMALYMDYGINFHSSVWHANITQESQVYFFTTVFGLTFGMESTNQFCSFDMNLRDGLMVYGTVKALTNYDPEPFELLNTQVADRRYEPIVRRN